MTILCAKFGDILTNVTKLVTYPASFELRRAKAKIANKGWHFILQRYRVSDEEKYIKDNLGVTLTPYFLIDELSFK